MLTFAQASPTHLVTLYFLAEVVTVVLGDAVVVVVRAIAASIRVMARGARSRIRNCHVDVGGGAIGMEIERFRGGWLLKKEAIAMPTSRAAPLTDKVISIFPSSSTMAHAFWSCCNTARQQKITIRRKRRQ